MKSKFTAKSGRKLIELAKDNRISIIHELKISLQAYGVNVCGDSSIPRTLIHTGHNVH